MNSQKQKLELLGNAPIPKALLAMGIPTMIGMLINALYNLVDAYFVGGLGESQMGAISIVYPLGQVVVGLGLLFGNGAASYISRLLGQGKEEQANKVASTSLYCSLSAGIILILFCVVFLKPILLLLGATKSILPYAMTYAGIYIISCIFNVFNVTMNNIVTSEGAAKTTMLALLTGAILNIALDPIFIYTFDLGVAGAAIANTEFNRIILSIKETMTNTIRPLFLCTLAFAMRGSNAPFTFLRSLIFPVLCSTYRTASIGETRDAFFADFLVLIHTVSAEKNTEPMIIGR